MEEIDTRTQAEFLAREHFHSPGAFNEVKFARDFALFIILRKQCIRFLKTGQINHRLAVNNAIIAINSFGSTAAVKIVALLFSEEQKPIMNAVFTALSIDLEDGIVCQKVLAILQSDPVRYNLG